jgi:hypothetical protein
MCATAQQSRIKNSALSIKTFTPENMCSIYGDQKMEPDQVGSTSFWGIGIGIQGMLIQIQPI